MEPLAERLRPRTLDDYIGQEHLVGEGAVLRRMIDSGRIASFILGDHRAWVRLRWHRLSLIVWKHRSIRFLP